MAVSSMAFFDWEAGLKFAPGPSQGPMRSLQGLDSIGLMKTIPQHIEGLDTLVKLRGGSENVEMTGLGGLLTW